MEEIIFVKVFKISLFNILMRKLFKMSSEKCEYHFVTITEAILQSGSVVKTSNFISQKNINWRSVYGFNASDIGHKILQRGRVT